MYQQGDREQCLVLTRHQCCFYTSTTAGNGKQGPKAMLSHIVQWDWDLMYRIPVHTSSTVSAGSSLTSSDRHRSWLEARISLVRSVCSHQRSAAPKERFWWASSGVSKLIRHTCWGTASQNTGLSQTLHTPLKPTVSQQLSDVHTHGYFYRDVFPKLAILSALQQRLQGRDRPVTAKRKWAGNIHRLLFFLCIEEGGKHRAHGATAERPQPGTEGSRGTSGSPARDDPRLPQPRPQHAARTRRAPRAHPRRGRGPPGWAARSSGPPGSDPAARRGSALPPPAWSRRGDRPPAPSAPPPSPAAALRPAGTAPPRAERAERLSGAAAPPVCWWGSVWGTARPLPPFPGRSDRAEMVSRRRMGRVEPGGKAGLWQRQGAAAVRAAEREAGGTSSLSTTPWKEWIQKDHKVIIS